MAYKTEDLEARIAKLESQIQAQQRGIKILALAATTSRGSVFDSPLQQFFDAPEFWEDIYQDEEACHSKCYQGFQARMKACEDAEDVEACKLKAVEETVDCHIKCDPLQPFP